MLWWKSRAWPVHVHDLYQLCLQTCSTHVGHIIWVSEVKINWLIIFCFSQFLPKNPQRRLGAFGDTRAIKDHRFFKTINWRALLEKRVKPPLGARSIGVSSSDSVFISCQVVYWKLWFFFKLVWEFTLSVGKMYTVFISNQFPPQLAEIFLTFSEIRCHI